MQQERALQRHYSGYLPLSLSRSLSLIRSASFDTRCRIHLFVFVHAAYEWLTVYWQHLFIIHTGCLAAQHSVCSVIHLLACFPLCACDYVVHTLCYECTMCMLRSIYCYQYKIYRTKRVHLLPITGENCKKFIVITLTLFTFTLNICIVVSINSIPFDGCRWIAILTIFPFFFYTDFRSDFRQT